MSPAGHLDLGGLTVEPGTGDPGSAAEEPVEVLGPDGSVTGVVPRRRMREEGLAHRATYVVTVLGDTPPPQHGLGVRESLSDRLEAWLVGISWPLLGPDHPGGRPRLVPRSWRPVEALGPDTRIVVHRRADWKDVYPGYWDLAFGGVCAVGEPWLVSAERELAEEAGLPTGRAASPPAAGGAAPVPVIPMGAGRYADGRSETFGVVFVAFTDREPEPTDGEVVAVDQVPVGRLGRWVADRPICPDSLLLVEPVLAALVDPSRP